MFQLRLEMNMQSVNSIDFREYLFLFSPTCENNALIMNLTRF